VLVDFIRSESESENQLEEPEDPELELNLAIESFLTKLEQSPQGEWPDNLKHFLEAVEPHCKVCQVLMSTQTTV
jgi:hypothetical protein